MLNYLIDKNEGTLVYRSEEEGPLCDPGSELPLGGSARRESKCDDNKWGEEKKYFENKSTLQL